MGNSLGCRDCPVAGSRSVAQLSQSGLRTHASTRVTHSRIPFHIYLWFAHLRFLRATVRLGSADAFALRDRRCGRVRWNALVARGIHAGHVVHIRRACLERSVRVGNRAYSSGVDAAICRVAPHRPINVVSRNGVGGSVARRVPVQHHHHRISPRAAQRNVR